MSDSARLFDDASAHVRAAADQVDLDPKVRAILSRPKNEVIVNFPVQRDSGVYELLQGYRIQHNNLLGPFKGGYASIPQSTSTRCGPWPPG